MKKYIFITPTLTDVGGAQMYVRNKVLFLKEKGWTVDVITSKKGEAGISELQVFKNHFPELGYCLYLFSKRKKERIIKRLTELIKDADYEEIIIESTCIPESTWAEMLSECIGAKHYIFLLQEDNVINNTGLQQFFIFKYNRKELAGIADNSLFRMFASFNPIDPKDSYRLSASCNNVEADVDHALIHSIDKSKYDYIVGTLSRVDKPFVIPAVQAFCNYAATQPKKKFLYLFIGGAPKNTNFEYNLKDTLKAMTTNVEVLITGFLYPIPTRLLEMCDVFFSSAGSVRPLYRSGVPCIAIDGNDFKPIGVFGRTTNHSLFRSEEEPPVSFSQLMDDVLVRKVFTKEPPNYRCGLPDFTNHFEFFSMSNQTKVYYNMNSICVDCKSEYKLKLALFLLGPITYSKLGLFKKKITRATNSDR